MKRRTLLAFGLGLLTGWITAVGIAGYFLTAEARRQQAFAAEARHRAVQLEAEMRRHLQDMDQSPKDPGGRHVVP
jgi:hypothetical protein